MKKILTTILVIGLTGSLIAEGQTTGQKMKDFVPKTNAYNIYYPESYTVSEGDENSVSISNPLTGLNITLSTYSIDGGIKDVDLISMLNGFIKSYYELDFAVSDWNNYQSKFDNLVVLAFKKDNINWSWYGISKNNRVLTFSVNKEEPVTTEEQNLIKYMIDNLDLH